MEARKLPANLKVSCNRESRPFYERFYKSLSRRKTAIESRGVGATESEGFEPPIRLASWPIPVPGSLSPDLHQQREDADDVHPGRRRLPRSTQRRRRGLLPRAPVQVHSHGDGAFPRESHELSRSGEPWRRVERLENIVDWFDLYLIGKPEPRYNTTKVEARQR